MPNHLSNLEAAPDEVRLRFSEQTICSFANQTNALFQATKIELAPQNGAGFCFELQ